MRNNLVIVEVIFSILANRLADIQRHSVAAMLTLAKLATNK